MSTRTTLLPQPQPILRPRRQRVVVGVDNSPSALGVVEWAAMQAQGRGVELHIVHTRDGEQRAPWSRSTDRLVLSGVERESRAIIKQCTALAHAHAGLAVTVEVIDGPAPEVLTHQSGDAGLLVVGSHHLTALDRAALGSVSGALVARALCPVVVLAALPGSQTGSAVVVGVTGTSDDQRVLDFAFHHASRYGLPLQALYFWNPPLADRTRPPPPTAQVWLSESLSGWRERFPDVTLHAMVVRDHPIDGLVAASAGQNLLVVGRHSRRTYLGGLLGSVSLGVLHHASCPVVVVPPVSSP